MSRNVPGAIRAVRRLYRWRPVPPRRGQQRSVLLVAQSAMMLKFLFDQRALLADDPRVAFACTSTEPPDNAAAIREECRRQRVPYLHPLAASFRSWDLAIFADHGGAECLLRAVPKLHVDHGFGGAKVIPGTATWSRFQRGCLIDRFGAPIYACMFESSHRRRDVGARMCPEAAGTIVVVGDLRADRILERNRRRREIRRSLGLADDRLTVMIGSTFGKESLMETVGPELVDAMRRLDGKYRFIVSTHPQHWQNREAYGTRYADLMGRLAEEGFVAHRPPQDTVDYLVAADVLVTDFGSLAVNYALLERPIVFTRFPREILAEGSAGRKLLDICVTLERPRDLESALLEARASHRPEAMRDICAEVLDYPGQAADRMRAELYRLLKLGPLDRLPGGQYS